MEKQHICWQDVWSMLKSSKQVQVLQVKDTNLNKLVFFFLLVLYNHLRHPSCTPQVLKEINRSFLCDNHMFFEPLTQNSKLQYLNLSITFLSCKKLFLGPGRMQYIKAAGGRLPAFPW